MALHKVVMEVTILLDEMDGTPDESGMIALDLASDALGDTFAHGDDADGRWGRDNLEIIVKECVEI